ncbi:hypothetical protein IGJ51_000387 [Enterococcus sp. DIV0802c]
MVVVGFLCFLFGGFFGLGIMALVISGKKADAIFNREE